MLSIAASADGIQVGYASLAYTIVGTCLVFYRQGFLFQSTLRPLELPAAIANKSKLLDWFLPCCLSGFSLILALLSHFILNSDYGLFMLVLCAAPFLVAYEYSRYLLHMLNLGTVSTVISGSWVICVGVIFSIGAIGRLELSALISLWFAVTSLALFASLMIALKVGPSSSSSQPDHWFPGNSLRVANRHFAVLAAIPILGSVMLMAIVVIFSGVESWGIVTLLSLALYPFALFTQALPLLVRQHRARGVMRHDSSQAWLLVSVALLAVFAWAGFLYVLPDATMAIFLGMLWPSAKEFLWSASLAYVCLAVLAYALILAHWTDSIRFVNRLLTSVTIAKVITLVVLIQLFPSVSLIEWAYLTDAGTSCITAVILIVVSRRNLQTRFPQ